jgi:hypothetical protein
MFQRRTVHRPYSDAQTLHWLHYLAQHLVSTSQTVFLIERMQPDRLRSHQRWHYILGIWLSFFLLAGSLGSVVLDPSRLIPSLIIGSVILAKIFGVDRIKPAETLQWSWQRARTYLLWGLAIGPLIGIALKYSFGLVFGRINWGVVDAVLIEQLIQGTIFGLTFGLTFGLIRGLSANAIATLTRPNQGIRQSARNALLFAAIATQAPMLIAWIIGGTKISFWGMFGLCFGLATGGGEACIKHCVLRIVLVAHRVAPWNYSKFLDYCCDRIFLQKVGGGYIFIHRLLLEHIARRSPSLGGTSTQTGFQ